jgi:hypothetical protein
MGVFVVVFLWSGCGGLGGKGGKWVVLKTVADFMHGFRVYFFGGGEDVRALRECPPGNGKDKSRSLRDDKQERRQQQQQQQQIQGSFAALRMTTFYC